MGFLFPAHSIDRFDDELNQIKSRYPDATHHCYAWRVNPNSIEEFAQDDGEPSGTAGLPILNKLKSFNVVNCGCIVVRYYGGTNLGKSGLIEAYGYAAQCCLDKASLAKLIPTQNFRIQYPYAKQSTIEQLKNQFDLKEISAEYLEQITLLVGCRLEQAADFSDALERHQHKGIDVDKRDKSFVTL